MLWLLTSQVAATFAGMAAAGFWWWAASMRPLILHATELPNIGGDSDVLMNIGDGQVVWFRNYQQGRLNASAAILTGAAVLLQTLTFWLALPPF